MTKLHLFGLASLMVLFTAGVSAQEPTNAFDDLKRGGEFKDSYEQMRIALSPAEISKLLETTPQSGYFIFTEDRANDVSRRDSLPVVWADRSPQERLTFRGSALPGEYYSFQIALYSPSGDLESPSLDLPTLKAKKREIPSEMLTCFNLSGVGSLGDDLEFDITIPKAQVQPLWVGVDIPADAKGLYQGEAVISFKNAPSERISIEINVEGKPIDNHGYNEGWRKSRLNWLNSNIGRQHTVTAPYIPIKAEKESISYLGGRVEWSHMGLPEQIYSLYDADNDLTGQRTPILAKGMRFVIETERGEESLEAASFELIGSDDTEAIYRSVSQNSRFKVICNTRFSYEGFSRFDINVEALERVDVKDIRLEVPYTPYASKYMMGLDTKGSLRDTKEFNWRWNVAKHQDKVWIGNVNAGLNLNFMDEEYSRALVNVYYDLGQLNLPKSWGNNCRGGVNIKTLCDEVLMKVYSGEREMFPGQKLNYNFQMLITPVRPRDFALQSQERFYHSNSDLSSEYIAAAKEAGANSINVHHKKDIYPFINYPYYDESVGDLKEFIESANSEGLKVRAYYTTRELTVKVPEFWALRSLGGEIFHDGPGRDARTLIHSNGPHQWLNDNLGTNFIPAWYNAFNEGKYKGDMDLSIITTPDSRWNNYYLEGLDWMIKEINLAGVYIDDSALDRVTLQRARRILDADGERRLVDIHSWNHFNPYAGFANSIHLYLELLPYVDRMWIGEGFPASTPADEWLVEMSGIAFGMTSESLDAHNIYRGMIYGMLPRLPWSGNPVPMWKLWDEFGMESAKMSGYWSDNCPISQPNEEVKVTLYKVDGKAMIVVANWSDKDQETSLAVDEKKLGFKISSISMPEIGGDIQSASDLKSLDNLKIPAEKGLFIIVE